MLKYLFLILTFPSLAFAATGGGIGGLGVTNAIGSVSIAGAPIGTGLTGINFINGLTGYVSSGSAYVGLNSTNILWGNSIFVSTNGNDSTGLRNHPTRPFRTANAAVAAYASNDTVFFFSGNYPVTNTLARNGINFHLFPGATLSMTNFLVITNSGTPRSIFDDIDGAVNFTVGGYGDLFYHAGNSWQDTNGIYGPALGIATDNSLIRGGIYLQNSNSSASVQVRNIYIYSHTALAFPPAAVWIENCNTFDLSFDNIIDPDFGGSVTIGLDEFDDPITKGSVVAGIWWELGDMYVNGKSIRCSSYGIYGSQPSGSTHVANLWANVDMVTNTASIIPVYFAGNGTSTRWKTWIDLKECGGPNAVAGYGIYTGGSHYLHAQKIHGDSAGVGISLTASQPALFWAEIEKIQTSGVGIKMNGTIPSGAFFDMNVQHIQDNGTMTAGVGFDGAGTMRLTGTRIAITNANGECVVKSGTGKLELSGCNLNNINSTGAISAIRVITNDALSVAHSIVVGPTNKWGFMSATTNSFRAPFTLVNNPSTNLLDIIGQLRTNANAL